LKAGVLPPPRRAASVTIDGRKVSFLVNVSSLADIAGMSADLCDGIGLVRTEFLIGEALHDEQRQFDAYAALVRWAGGKPVTIRTIDAGGDKPIDGYTPAGDRNPFLGLRGIRLSLLKPDLFRLQLRAIARAAALGPVRVVLPMVSLADEVTQARAHLAGVMEELRARGIACAEPSLGMMVEVPAAAMAPQIYDVDFMSIGSNDLAQYAVAAARDNLQVAHSLSGLHPGVLSMIAYVARFAGERHIEVSLCGDVGGDPTVLESLTEAGIRSFSVAPSLLSVTRQTVRGLAQSGVMGDVG
jgi:phosphoenolpyruvate-protein phosphotransferase (PTS system enzyme I)